MQIKEEFFSSKKRELGVSLNSVQKEAVLNTEGPLLLLASPGSGKTTTIIMRIGYLIQVKGIDPTKIKAVTFSNASAKDMKERYKRFFPNLPPVDFWTIHSLAFKVVREYFYRRGIDYQLIEGEVSLEDQKRNQLPLNKKILLRKIFKSINAEAITDDQLDELTSYISFIKNKLIPEEQWSSVSCTVPNAIEIIRGYENFKKSGTSKLLVDYDDMLTIANVIFEKERTMLSKYQQLYEYVLTDESQDTSLVQHSIMEKLVQTHKNLCVVADDDQSIYGWRAAEPQYLLDFQKVYPNALILMMEQNYRSSKDIVDVANQFIKRNKNRYDKNMFTENPPHHPIVLETFMDYNDQSEYLVEQIAKIENFREVAVLFRNNSSSIILLDAFDNAGIPFYMKDSDNRFFKHWIVQDILNFMRLSYDDGRIDIFERIYSKFNFYLTKSHLDQLKRIRNNESVFDKLINSIELKDFQISKIKECKKIYSQMKERLPCHVIRTIRKDFGYEKVLKKMCKELGFKMDYFLEILNTLEKISESSNTLIEFANRIKYLESLMKTSKFNKNKNAVTFSTLHSSKGLEFEKVYMIDLIEGVMPSKIEEDLPKEAKDAEMEEAVRLFYVGMTRAKLNLELLSYKRKYEKFVSPSQLVNNVKNLINPPKEQPKRNKAAKIAKGKPKIPYNPNAIRDKENLKAGIQVKHRVFGTGEIVECTDEIIEIRFNKKSKQLSISTCFELGLIEPVN